MYKGNVCNIFQISGIYFFQMVFEFYYFVFVFDWAISICKSHILLTDSSLKIDKTDELEYLHSVSFYALESRWALRKNFEMFIF